MYCPTCGTEALTNQKFCRSCGMELQEIFRLFAEHVSATDPALLPVEIDFGIFHHQPGMQPQTEPTGLPSASSREAKPSATKRTTGSLAPIIHEEPQVHK